MFAEVEHIAKGFEASGRTNLSHLPGGTFAHRLRSRLAPRSVHPKLVDSSGAGQNFTHASLQQLVARACNYSILPKPLTVALNATS